MTVREVPWHDCDDPVEAARRLRDTVDLIVSDDDWRLSACRVYDDMYEGRLLAGLDDARWAAAGRMGCDPSLLNLVKTAVDYVHSKVAAQVPDVRVVSQDGDFRTAVRARRATRWVDACMDQLGCQTTLPELVRVALRTGTGVVKSSVEDGRVLLEVVPPTEVFFDEDDARYGRPTCSYQRRGEPRERLLADFADDEEALAAIENGQAPRDDHARPSARPRDLVEVTEGWLLPRGDRPGRHLVAVGGGYLVDEEWAHPRHPFALMCFFPPAPGEGVWGHGLVEHLERQQLDIDWLLAKMNRMIRVGSQLRYFVPFKGIDEEGMASLEHGDDGSIVEFNGMTGQPVIATPSVLPGDLFKMLEFKVQQFYAAAGTTPEAAQSQRPAGIESGRGISYWNDLQTQRFAGQVQRFSKAVVDVAQLVMDRAADLEGDEGADLSVLSAFGPIDWAEASIDSDKYRVELKPVSPVPDSFAGWTQFVERALQDGSAPPEYAASLFENPDVWAVQKRAAADSDWVDWVVDLLLDEDLDMPPLRDEQNLALTLSVLRTELLNAVREGAGPDVVARFEDYMDRAAAAKRLAEESAMAQQTNQAPPPTGGPATEGAPPAPPAMVPPVA